MLHTLVALQKRAPVSCYFALIKHSFFDKCKVNFSIACATVDPQTESFDPSPLIPYLQSLNITYHYLSEPIVSLAKSKLQVHNIVMVLIHVAFKIYHCLWNNL